MQIEKNSQLYIYRYRIQDTEENFNKIGEVITQREFYINATFCI